MTTKLNGNSITQEGLAMRVTAMKLYIFEGTVPKGAPQPFMFQVSQGWVDKNGQAYSYRTMYNNQFHEIEGYPKPQVNPAQE